MKLTHDELVFKADLMMLQLRKDESSDAKRVYELLISALEGDALSKKLVADCYYAGDEVYKSYASALYWYKEAKEAGIDTQDKILEIEKMLK